MSELNLKLLFTGWLDAKFDELTQKGLKVAYAYAKALEKIRAHPGRIATPRELSGIQCVGPKLVKFLFARLKSHCKTNALPVPVEFENYAGDAAGGKRTHELDKDTTSKKKPASKWVPKRRGGSWAILVSLYIKDRAKNGLRKEDIIAVAEQYCDSSFTANPAARDYYSAWDGVKTLIKRELVVEFGRPKTYVITEEGERMAAVLLKQEGIHSSPAKAPDSSFDNGVRVSPETSGMNSLGILKERKPPGRFSSPLKDRGNAVSSVDHVVDLVSDDEAAGVKEARVKETVPTSPPKSFTDLFSHLYEPEPEPQNDMNDDDILVAHDVTHAKEDDIFAPLAASTDGLDVARAPAPVPSPAPAPAPIPHVESKLHRQQPKSSVKDASAPKRAKTNDGVHRPLPTTPIKSELAHRTLSMSLAVDGKINRTQPTTPLGNHHMHRSHTTIPTTNSKSTRGNHDVERKIYDGVPYDVWAPEDFEIVLLLDNREIRSLGERDFFHKKLVSRNVTCDVRALSVGDVLWVARHKQTKKEVVLNYICERKRIDDLASSIKDGRFSEQKSRLKKSGIRNVYYLVEEGGLGDIPRIVDMKASIETAISMVITISNFYLQRFRRIDDTVDWLTTMTDVLKQKYLTVRLLVVKPFSVRSQDDYLQFLECFRAKFESRKTAYECVHSFALFQDLLVKTKMMTVKEMFIKMLMLIRGISFEKAILIQRHFQTPRALMEYYMENAHLSESEKGQLILDKFSNELGPRKFNKSSLIAMYEAWGKSVC